MLSKLALSVLYLISFLLKVYLLKVGKIIVVFKKKKKKKKANYNLPTYDLAEI